MEENIRSYGLFSDDMTIIKGIVATSNDLVIAGKFSGSIASIASVTIDAGADVDGEIIAENVNIIGKFKGKIAARDLVTISKGSIINGKVVYGRLNVEDGAVICAATSIITNAQFKRIAESDKVYRTIRKPAPKVEAKTEKK